MREDRYHRRRREEFLSRLVHRATVAARPWASEVAPVVTTEESSPFGGPSSEVVLSDLEGREHRVNETVVSAGFRLMLADRQAHYSATAVEALSTRARDRMLAARSVNDAESIQDDDLGRLLQLGLYGQVKWRTLHGAAAERKGGTTCSE